MAFELEKMTAAKLNSANFRTQLHGQEHVPAVDLSLTVDAPNDILTCFDGHLKSALYMNNANDAGQPDLEGVPKVLPNLRLPKLGLPLKWDAEGKGYTLTIDHGLGEDAGSNIELDLCTVGEFRITPREGGTVEVKFRVQTASEALTEAVRGKLTSMIQSEVEIMLTAPVAPVTVSSEPEPPMPTSPDEVSRALFTEPGATGAGDEDTPEKAMLRAHGVDDAGDAA